MQFGKALPVAEITIAEGQTQRPSNPFCVLGEFQTGFIFRGQNEQMWI
jgi:hypothetical protein